jgi:hypothetical protein
MTKDHITDDDVKPENLRITISMRIPGDLLDAYREKAERLGVPYQTLMQMKLREGLERDDLGARVAALENVLKRPITVKKPVKKKKPRAA